MGRGYYWLLMGLLLLVGCDSHPPAPSRAMAVANALGGESAGFARASGPRTFQFPADHGAHRDYRNEWWYLTGHLEDEAGGRYGFQITFFRIGLRPTPVRRSSAWATHEVWMGHLAISDGVDGHFYAFERFSRGAAELAGVQAAPFKVWIEDWQLAEQGDGQWRLQASAAGVAIDLLLRADKPVVLQGEGGLSQKSAEVGNASYYYSLPRMSAHGHLTTTAGGPHPVSGSGWLDREWSTSALAPDQQGWDWFSLQLEDGRELMYYRLRRHDGSVDPHSAGAIIDVDGQLHPLTPQDVQLEPEQFWESPQGGRYPVGWRMAVAPLGRVLRIAPLLPQQELDLTVRYWEGAVLATTLEGAPLAGRGYLEMTGYAP